MSEILTYTGVMFDPTHPNPELIDPRDIAHALSMLCRANGHFPHFYSVAQHSLNCMREAQARGYSPRVVLGCLLHDGSEAYLSDVTRPVKALLPQYKEAERVLQDVIYEKWLSYAPSEEELAEISAVDDCVLYYEFLTLTGRKLYDTAPPLLSSPIFDYEELKAVEEEFLKALEAAII